MLTIEEKIIKLFPNSEKCRDCNKEIVYYDTRVTETKINGKSFLSYKEVFNTKYYLGVCEKCLTAKHPSYAEKNKSRVFNKLVKYTLYAYNIPESVANDWNSQFVGLTLEKMVRKYGKEEGNARWNKYKEKQAYSNTYEYKKEKHN